MAKTEPRTLSGFMELLPDEQILFNQMKRTIEETYQKYGFLPLDTPVIELSEVLLAKAGGETEKQIYRFNKGDNDLSLRFDLTVPLSKYVAKNYGNLNFPFRRYQIGKVYRGERTQKGRFREFYQCDIDVIGDGELDLINDAELPSVIYTIFTKLGFSNFTIRINNRKILNGLFESLNQKEKAVEILRIIDKIDKIGKDAVIEELEKIEVEKEAVEKVKELALEKGAKRVIPLNTSGPFHTALLKEASLALKERFQQETFHEMKIPVIFNTLGHEIECQSIPEILEKQVMSPVYFEKSIRYMIDQGVDTIIEVGPGKVLSGFVRKIDRSIQLYQIEDMESLKKTVKALKGE